MTEVIIGDGRDLPAVFRARTPRFIYRVVKFIVLGLLLLFAGLLLLPWQQNVRGEGRIVAFDPTEREQSVDAPIDGRVVEWFVQEGSRVKAGDALFRIADNDPNLLQRFDDQKRATERTQIAAESKAEIYSDSVKALLDAQNLTRTAANERVRQARQKVIAVEQKLEAAKIAIQIAEIRYERQKNLRDDGLGSEQNYESYLLDKRKAAAERAQVAAELEAARADVLAKEADRDEKIALVEQKIQSARAQRETALSDAAKAEQEVTKLDTRIARQNTQDVTATVDATVHRLIASQGRQGQFVKAGDPCVVLVPDSEHLAVELWVDGNDQPFVEIGRPVRLQFEGWPAAFFASGWPDAAVGTFGGIVKLVDPADDGRGRFRMLVVPDPRERWPEGRFLRQGVQARGWVLLEEVALGYEFWRVLNGFPPNFNVRESATETGSEPKKS